MIEICLCNYMCGSSYEFTQNLERHSIHYDEDSNGILWHASCLFVSPSVSEDIYVHVWYDENFLLTF